MQNTRKIIDRAALKRNRKRADASKLFLHEIALAETQSRLEMINRPFDEITVITPFPAIWTKAFPKARILLDSDILPLKPEFNDLIVHTMCMHWTNDLVGQLIQCRRGLKPDGLCLVVMLGGETLAELRFALRNAESDTVGRLSPRVLPMSQIKDLGALLQRAGFALPVVDSLVQTAEYQDLYHLLRDLRLMGENNALIDRIRQTSRRDLFLRAQSIYAEKFATESGNLKATFEIMSLTGWAPSESQPKPLRPGSASARLADALSTTESILPT